MKITANHAHLIPPDSTAQGWPAGDMPLLLRHLDACGIDQAVIFPPFACQMGGSLWQANRWALGEARRHPDRIIAAGTVAPLHPDVLDVLHFLHHEGVRLAKIHPSVDCYDISDSAAGPCYATAEALGIALDFHTGPHGTRLALADPVKFDELAWQYPRLKLVFEHLGGRTYAEQFLAIIHNHHASPGRVFGGLTSVLARESKRMRYLGPERVEEMIACAGADVFIFGLDFPWNPPETTRRDLEILRSLPLPADDLARILGGNLRALVGIA